MYQEKSFSPTSGALMIVIFLLALIGILFSVRLGSPIPAAILGLAAILILPGFMIIPPNSARVLVLFGVYKGTIKQNGFFWVNPFMLKNELSLRARNLNGQSLKVNDKLGNPIEIAAVIVWQIEDTAKAVFEVNDYNAYVSIQSEAAVRHLAGSCPYDNFEDEGADVTLRGSSEKVVQMLEDELNERLNRAGIRVTEARISHLAYAPEIASAMLQRQQATAIIAARKQIVEGAVGMVEMALQRLSDRGVVHLDENRKAAMVSNLLVVLCGEKNVSPMVNTGLS